MTTSEQEYRLAAAEKDETLRWAASESDRRLHERRMEVIRPEEREER